LSSRVIKALGPTGDTWCLVLPKANGFDEQEPSRSAEAILLEAEARAEAVLGEAQAGARRILGEAERRAAEVVEEARSSGFAVGCERGYLEGQAQARAENAGVVAQVRSLAQAAEREQQRLLAQMEPQLVDLALTVARKVVGEGLRLQPDLVTEVVARAIAEAQGSGHHLIRLHPLDVQLLEPYLPRAAIEAGGQEWDVVPDDSLGRGDCLIETAFGVVDACIETQFRELAHLLRGRRADESSGD